MKTNGTPNPEWYKQLSARLDAEFNRQTRKLAAIIVTALLIAAALTAWAIVTRVT